MNRFLETLAGNLAERWLTLLILPGALYLATAIAATRLGHVHWYRIDLLSNDLTKIAAEPAARYPGTLALELAGLLAAAAGAGILNQALGTLCRAIWFAPARGALTRELTRRRRHRWDAADRRFREATVAAGEAQLVGEQGTADLVRQAEERAAARNAIGWSDQRDRSLRAIEWPRLINACSSATRWTSHRHGRDCGWCYPIPLAPQCRRRTARSRPHNGSPAGGFAYLPLTVVWWPAGLIAVVGITMGWRRAVSATCTLADLVEAAVDLHARTLARTLGLRSPGPLDRQTGTEITALLRKGV